MYIHKYIHAYIDLTEVDQLFIERKKERKNRLVDSSIDATTINIFSFALFEKRSEVLGGEGLYLFI